MHGAYLRHIGTHSSYNYHSVSFFGRRHAYPCDGTRLLKDSSTDLIPLNPQNRQHKFYIWRNSLVSEVERKELKLAFCPGCGTYLQKAFIAQAEQICPCCGRDQGQR